MKNRVMVPWHVVLGVYLVLWAGGIAAAAPAMTIDQTLSDEAQAKTIAFDALAFLTGDLCSDSFLPPGKVADFSGFQYLRDNDPTGLGHNTDFVTIIANNMLNILDEGQIGELVALAGTQIEMINQYGYGRFPLMAAFRRHLQGDIPDGAAGLSLDAVKAYSGELYRLDGRISYDRAKTLGRILRNMDPVQTAKLDALAALNGVGNWDATLPDLLKEMYPDLSQAENVAVMTYASEMYSWYAGSVAADTYFCPERQGTYFGSFYMKDMPAMGNAGFTIPSELTADMGQAFLDVLTPEQAALVTDLVEAQKTSLYGIVDAREAISTMLRQFMATENVDEAAVLELAAQYGQLDGEIVFAYAAAFAVLNAALTPDQAAGLVQIRESWNTAACSGAFLYSEAIAMPDIADTDFLFGIGDSPGVENAVAIDSSPAGQADGNIVMDGAEVELLADGFVFAEGPAAYSSEVILFNDIGADRFYAWSKASGTVLLEEGSGGNGLFFDGHGTLYICQSKAKTLMSKDVNGKYQVLADSYAGLPLNGPNDLWVDAKAGVYFSDPVYANTRTQDGEHVYYLTPKRDNLMRVIGDMVRPNGIVGSPDGRVLYVTDHGAGATYRYTVEQNGGLSGKTLFVPIGGDGMAVDADGNVYLCQDTVLVFDDSGSRIHEIVLPEAPTNLCFGGPGNMTLFITTRTGLYALEMAVAGVSALAGQ